MTQIDGRRARWNPIPCMGAWRALFASLALVLSAASWPEAPSSLPSASETPRISGNELERLSAISTRLATLNERLRTELEASRLKSVELEDSLALSTRELATLRLELEEFRRTSTELELRATNSERESIALSEALRKADASLKSLEGSFADYRKAAEARSRGLWFAGAAAFAGWGLAIFVIIVK